MTTNEEAVVYILREAANRAGYSTRMAAEGFVGVIAPAKVCKLLAAAHELFVAELESRETANARDHK